MLKNEMGWLTRVARVGIAASVFTIAGVAQAGSETGFYIGAGVGSATVEDNPSNVTFEESDAGYKLFAGLNFGVIPLLNLAVEGGIVNFGNPQGSNVSYEITGLDAFGLVGMTFGPIAFFGKAGLVSWDSDVTVGNASATADSGTDGAFGLGAQFKLLSLAIRAEYEEFSISDVDTLNLFSASLTYTF